MIMLNKVSMRTLNDIITRVKKKINKIKTIIIIITLLHFLR